MKSLNLLIIMIYKLIFIFGTVYLMINHSMWWILLLLLLDFNITELGGNKDE